MVFKSGQLETKFQIGQKFEGYICPAAYVSLSKVVRISSIFVDACG